MGVEHILHREEELLDALWPYLSETPNLVILADQHRERLGVISFYIKGLHYNLGVKLLNDRYGIQVRGGCSCAGTYGHYLLEVSESKSHSITDKIDRGDLTEKPGWIRLSIHPTMTVGEMEYIGRAIQEVAANFREWARDYEYNKHTNEYGYPGDHLVEDWVDSWFA
jgi:selenocysteine lyase/cysteine desulfurase